MNPLVSIVCVTHGRRQLLMRCLESCLQQDHRNLEIVVLLNPGDPEAESAIRDAMPQVKIVRTHRNVGFFPGLNLAIANTNGEYVMTVDDDAYFLSNDVLSQMLRAFAVEPELGGVTCNLEGPKETTISGDDRYIHVFKTGFTMVPKRAFTEWVGYYPDLFFRSAGETFLCTALWNQGRRVKCLVHARMYHDLAMQGRSDHDWKFYGMRSQALCVVLREPWFIVPFSLASKFCKSFLNFIKWGHLQTWFRVWWSILVHIPEVIPDRQPVTWNTYKLLRRLQTEVITDPAQLSGLAVLTDRGADVVGHPTADAPDAPAPVASVVIATKNRKDELRVAVQSALKQTVPVEVIVMDDASTDGTSEMMRTEYPQVRLYTAAVSAGYIVQRNRAAELARAPIIFSLDDDAAFSTPRVVAQTLAEFTSPQIGAIFIPLINVRTSHEIVNPAPADGRAYATDSFVGTAYALRRDVFLQLGGYREFFVHQGEEGDYCLRMLEAGYLTRAGGADPISHFESVRRDFSRMDFYGKRNLVLFAWCNVPAVFLPLHLVATVFNGLWHGVRVNRLAVGARGMLSGMAAMVRGVYPRNPVSLATYRLSRKLKKRGPLGVDYVLQRLALRCGAPPRPPSAITGAGVVAQGAKTTTLQ